MILYLTATTSVPDLIVDFIEVQLKNGEVVSLNWDESWISRTETGFEAEYKGVYFNEEYANGRLDDLQMMKVKEVGLYSETNHTGDIAIEEMVFEDGERELVFEAQIYAQKGCDLSG